MGQFLKQLKEACTQDNFVNALRKVRVIDDNYIKEQDVRRVLCKCDAKYQTIKTVSVSAWGAATDATRTFVREFSNQQEEIPPFPVRDRVEPESGPHISPKIRSFIEKYDKNEKIDVNKLDHQVGVVKNKSKVLIAEMDRQFKRVRNAAGHASTVFVSSYSDRMKASQKKDGGNDE